MNSSSEHINNSSSESINYSDEKYMNTGRVVVFKGDETLLGENSTTKNRVGKDSTKSGTYEILGGKAFDDEKERGRFFKGIHPRFFENSLEKKLLETAVSELAEESGVYIGSHRLKKVGVQTREIEGVYEKFPQAEYINTHYYSVVLNDEEYKELGIAKSSMILNDDNHENIKWQDNDIIIGGDYIEMLAKNSQMTPEIIENITDLEESSKNKINEVLGIAKEGGNHKDKNGNSSSLIDYKIESISYDDFISAYKEYFHIKENNDSLFEKKEIEVIKQLFQDHVIDFSLENLQFKNPGFYNDNRIENLKKYLLKLVNGINNLEEFYLFFNKGANNDDIGKQLYNDFLAFRSLYILDYFPYINENTYQSFEGKLNEVFSNKTKDFSGNKVDINFDSNIKAIDRMAEKNITKPEISPEKIKDVYRGRVIVENTKDIKSIITILEKKFGNDKTKKQGSWNLKEKKRSGNTTGGNRGDEVKIIGKYPVTNNNGKTFYIPIEIQVMSKAAYKKGEAAEMHHLVYTKLQKTISTTRGNIGIHPAGISSLLDTLANDKDIQNSYKLIYKGKKAVLNSSLRDRIKGRLHKFLFRVPDTDGIKKHYAYQNIINARGKSEIISKQDEIFAAMCENINEEIGVCLTPIEWDHIFNGDTNKTRLKDSINKFNEGKIESFFLEKQLGLSDDILEKILQSLIS